MTQATTEIIGLKDRGALLPGLRADINVIDYARLAIGAPEVCYDLPAGGKRLLQRATGYDATMVGGKIVCRDGVPTDTLPGRLVRAC